MTDHLKAIDHPPEPDDQLGLAGLAAPLVPWWKVPFVVLDCETTGVDPQVDRLVTCSIVTINEDGTVAEAREWMAQCPEIADDAVAIHGITPERSMAEGRPAVEVMREIHDVLRRIKSDRLPVVIFNVPFDWQLLTSESQRLQLHGGVLPSCSLIDPHIIDRKVDKYRRGPRTLVTMAGYYGLEFGEGDLHDATVDATVTAGVLRKMAQKYKVLQRLGMEELHTYQIRWYRDWVMGLVAYWRREGKTEKDGTTPRTKDPGWPLFEGPAPAHDPHPYE